MKHIGYIRLVQGIGRACQGARPEGHPVSHIPGKLQMLKIAGQHGKIRHEVMTEQDWLGPLQMSVSRHDDIAVFFRRFHDGLLQLDEQPCYVGNFPAQVQMGIERYLVIAAAAGVQALARFTDGISQPFFYIHMNIFQFDGKFEFIMFNLFKYLFQAVYDGVFIFIRNNSLTGQHRRMGDTATDIFCIHTAIKLNRRIECFYIFIRRLRKPAAP